MVDTGMLSEFGPRPEGNGDSVHRPPELKRWWLFAVLCVGALMIDIDGTVVVVALPSIGSTLNISKASLVGVVNAYTAANGGFFLFSGRLCDRLGFRRLFVVGISVFTIASVGCAFSGNYFQLVLCRVLQGLAGAAVVTATFSSVVTLFSETVSRARAMGILAFVCSVGGILGLLSGGALTESLGWRWVFLINLPVGMTVYLLCRGASEKNDGAEGRPVSLGLFGALLITASLVTTVLAIQGVEPGDGCCGRPGWLSICAGVLFLVFVGVEARTATPLIPLSILRMRNLVLCTAVSILSSVVGASSVFASMYLQFVLGLTPLEVAFAFIPPGLTMAIFSLGLSAKIVAHFGTRVPLAVGLAIGSSGLLLLGQAIATGGGIYEVLLGLVIVAAGVGIACTPSLVAAMSEVKSHESGLASGVISTATMMGSAIGLAVLGILFATYQMHALGIGMTTADASNRSYQFVFIVCAVLNAVAIPLALSLREGDRVSDGCDIA